jgi:hypothetical protein
MHQFKKTQKCIDEFCHYWMSLPPLAHVINFHVFSAQRRNDCAIDYNSGRSEPVICLHLQEENVERMFFLMTNSSALEELIGCDTMKYGN